MLSAGNAGPDSDVDLLVVMTPKRSKAEQELDILKLLHSHRIPKDVIVTTPEVFAWRSKIPGTIERPAALGGRVLYAKR
jgi:predicted nucleotidyltransferase